MVQNRVFILLSTHSYNALIRVRLEYLSVESLSTVVITAPKFPSSLNHIFLLFTTNNRPLPPQNLMAKGKGGQSQKKDKETKEQRKARLQAEKQSIEQVRQTLEALVVEGGHRL